MIILSYHPYMLVKKERGYFYSMKQNAALKDAISRRRRNNFLNSKLNVFICSFITLCSKILRVLIIVTSLHESQKSFNALMSYHLTVKCKNFIG